MLVRDLRRAGPPRVVSRASGAGGALADGPSSDAAISADGRRVAFTSAATNLAAAKPDNRRGVFARDLRRQTTTLVSPPAPDGPAATPPPAGPVASPSTVAIKASTTPKLTQSVSIFDNAFYDGGERPTVRLRAGGVLTWRFASQQSHQVTVRKGPSLVRSPPQAAGAWSARLKRPGTYEFVCAIHAPGMRMTAVVVK
ncbi:MAG: hypothetical protein QOJ89_4265 [bacterium]